MAKWIVATALVATVPIAAVVGGVFLHVTLEYGDLCDASRERGLSSGSESSAGD